MQKVESNIAKLKNIEYKQKLKITSRKHQNNQKKRA
jgi:hypothetical protein